MNIYDYIECTYRALYFSSRLNIHFDFMCILCEMGNANT